VGRETSPYKDMLVFFGLFVNIKHINLWKGDGKDEDVERGS
jgi:hypothetical protein